MTQFNTSLLREKFTIKETMPSDLMDNAPVIALSNRLVLRLQTTHKVEGDTLIIRAQNMHSCVRMAAHLAKDFHESGPLLNRVRPFDWQHAYEIITRGFEKKWNPDRWISIYHKGRVIFEGGEKKRHPFLDIIEQCDARNKGDYDAAVKVAEDAFMQAGKLVKIHHDSNVAMIINVTDEECKCGIINRAPNRTTTFNFTAKPKEDRLVRLSQCLTAAAAFLEAIQLAYFIGITKQRLYYELLDLHSPEAKKADDAAHKLGRLRGAVTQFEKLLSVTYRPERPDFSEMIDHAEQYARKILVAEIENRDKDQTQGNWIG